MQVDIIYSITCHESPDSFADTIENIKYFNRGHRIAIIVNANPVMHRTIREDDVVRLLPNPWNKRTCSHDIFTAHMQNYKYSQEKSITATYFIMLASNCMFHRQITLDEIEEGVSHAPPCDVKTLSRRGTDWHWPPFYKNAAIVSSLAENGIHTFIASEHEGMIIPYNIMSQIYTFVTSNRLIENIIQQTVFEEIFPGTLYAYFTGKKPYHICKVFWEKPGCAPSIDDIRACGDPCVKRVARTMQNPVRQWLLSLRNSP